MGDGNVIYQESVNEQIPDGAVVVSIVDLDGRRRASAWHNLKAIGDREL